MVPNTDMEKMIATDITNTGEEVKAKVVGTIEATFEDGLPQSCFESNEGLKYSIFNIVKHTLTGVMLSSPGKVLKEMQVSRIIQTKPIVVGFVCSILSSTTFFMPMADFIGNLVNKAFEHQYLKHVDENMTCKILTESSLKRCWIYNTKSSSEPGDCGYCCKIGRRYHKGTHCSG